SSTTGSSFRSRPKAASPSTTRSSPDCPDLSGVPGFSLAPVNSVEERHVVGDRGALLCHRLVDARAEVDESDELLVLAHPDRRLSFPRLQHAWRAPVRGEAAPVRGDQHDIDGAPGGERVLVVLVLVSG